MAHMMLYVRHFFALWQTKSFASAFPQMRFILKIFDITNSRCKFQILLFIPFFKEFL